MASDAEDMGETTTEDGIVSTPGSALEIHLSPVTSPSPYDVDVSSSTAIPFNGTADCSRLDTDKININTADFAGAYLPLTPFSPVLPPVNLPSSRQQEESMRRPFSTFSTKPTLSAAFAISTQPANPPSYQQENSKNPFRRHGSRPSEYDNRSASPGFEERGRRREKRGQRPASPVYFPRRSPSSPRDEDQFFNAPEYAPPSFDRHTPLPTIVEPSQEPKTHYPVKILKSIVNKGDKIIEYKVLYDSVPENYHNPQWQSFEALTTPPTIRLLRMYHAQNPFKPKDMRVDDPQYTEAVYSREAQTKLRAERMKRRRISGASGRNDRKRVQFRDKDGDIEMEMWTENVVSGGHQDKTTLGTIGELEDVAGWESFVDFDGTVYRLPMGK